MVGALLKWRRGLRENPRVDVVRAVLNEFAQQGNEEISLPALTESIMELQKTNQIGYEFPEGLFYCYTLSEDLRRLEFSGELTSYEYRHDGFLPKSYFASTLIGQHKASRAVEKLDPTLRIAIRNSVANAIELDSNRWRLFGRKERRAWGRPD